MILNLSCEAAPLPRASEHYFLAKPALRPLMFFAAKALFFSDEEQLLFLSRIPNISPRITENASDYLC